MSEIEQKHIDRYLLLEKLHHRLEGSLHSSTDILSAAYGLGFETDYSLDLLKYLKVNGYIEAIGKTTNVMLTPFGLRTAMRIDLAA
jgi:hypothetical protein